MRVRRLVLAVVLLAAVAFTGSAPAQAAGPVLTQDVTLRLCEGTNFICPTSITPVLRKGTAVTMVCWIDATWTDGKSHRWFYVTASGNREGYAMDRWVSPQVATTSCTSTAHRPQWVTRWAVATLGSQAYDNACLKWVYDLWNVVGINIGKAENPAKYWAGVTRWPRHTASDPRWKVPPRGALVFWNGRPRYTDGHVAISMGNGYILSTYERSYPGVHLTTIAERNKQSALNSTYLGWILPT